MNLNKLLAEQLSEKEAIIYLLVESGFTFRAIAEPLGVSHEHVRGIYTEAKKKIKKH